MSVVLGLKVVPVNGFGISHHLSKKNCCVGFVQDVLAGIPKSENGKKKHNIIKYLTSGGKRGEYKQALDLRHVTLVFLHELAKPINWTITKSGTDTKKKKN